MTFVATTGCNQVEEIATDVTAQVRPSIDEAGHVAAAMGQQVIFDGESYEEFDLEPYELEFASYFAKKGVQVHGDLVYLTTWSWAFPYFENEVHVWNTSTGSFERIFGNDAVQSDIAVSSSGILVFSDFGDHGKYTIYRRPSGGGPLETLIPHYHAFHTLDGLDVNDSGATIAVVSGPFDPVAGLHVAYVDEPVTSSFEFPWDELKSPLYGVAGDQAPTIAINNEDEVVLGIANDTEYRQSTADDYIDLPAGVYLSEPRELSEEIVLQTIAQKGADFCRFGAVDISDSGEVYFEALLTGSDQCDAAEVTSYSGIYRGPRARDVVVDASDRPECDGVLMGEMNNRGQVAFLAVSSQQGEPHYTLVRYTPPHGFEP